MAVPKQWGPQSVTPETLNHVPPTDNRDSVFQIKETLVAAGWTVEESGDGTSYNASADIITTAADLRNNNAWFRISNPDGHELTIQHVASGAHRVKYSPSPFDGGSPDATTTPEATPTSDEQILMGGGTDAAPTGGATGWLYDASDPRVIGIADDVSPYGFCFTHFNGTEDESCFVMDPVIIPDSGWTDPQPYVFLLARASSGSVYLNTRINNPNRSDKERAQGWNVTGAQWDSWGLAEPFFRASSQTYVNNSPSSDNAGNIPTAFGGFWVRTAAAANPDGYKGGSQMFLYTGANITGKNTHIINGSGKMALTTDGHVFVPYHSSGDMSGLTASPNALFVPSVNVPIADATAPTITNFSPATTETILTNTAIEFDITDAGGFAGIIVFAELADGTVEMVHDGFAFRGNYVGNPNARTTIANGFHYRIRRSGGWPKTGAAPTVKFEYAVFDASGNAGTVS